MTAGAFVVGGPVPGPGPWLRTVTEEDQARLVEWRTACRHAFFRQEPIDGEGQRLWFRGYRDRPEDFLFAVMEGGEAVGCLGVRLLDGGWDVYNVIRGRRTPGSRGFMGRALEMAVAFARERRERPVGLVVLAGNPAEQWYRRHGFVATGRDPECVTMEWVGPAEGGRAAG